jgi:glycosyltransferase involved in cell wall biosynthesis
MVACGCVAASFWSRPVFALTDRASMKSIRLLFVQPVLAPYSIPRYRLLARCKGFQVRVALEAATFRERPGWQNAPIEGCDVEVLKAIRFTKQINVKDRHFTEKYTKTIPFGLILSIWRHRPDAVLVCNPTQLLLARLAALRCQLAVGLLLEDTLLSEMHKNFLVRWLRKMLYQTADFVFCYSRDAQNYMRHLGLKARSFRTSWSIDSEIPEASDASSTGGHHRRTGNDNEMVRFLYVGALTERKGVMLLLKAWLSFVRHVSDVELEFVGDGNLKNQMKAFCASCHLTNVKFRGYLPKPEVNQQYARSDVLILPTLQDLYSLVVPEAMAFGLPILTTIYNGARELVTNGKNGYIFNPLDHDEFLMVLRQTYLKRSQLNSMGRVSKRRIANYTHSKVVNKMCEDLESLFSERRSFL